MQENGRRCVVVPKAAASKESRYFETNEAVEIIIEKEKRSAVWHHAGCFLIQKIHIQHPVCPVYQLDELILQLNRAGQVCLGRLCARVPQMWSHIQVKYFRLQIKVLVLVLV